MVSLVIFGNRRKQLHVGSGIVLAAVRTPAKRRESTAHDAVVAHRRVTWRGSHRKPRYEREGRACSRVRPAAKRQIEEGTGSPAPSSTLYEGV